MKDIDWEVTPGALDALLTSDKQVYFADLLTIITNSGEVLRWSCIDIPVTINAQTWVVGPVVTRTGIDVKVGVEVSTMVVKISPGASTYLIDGLPVIAFIVGGGFDGASIELRRVFSAGVGQPWQGSLLMFSGVQNTFDASRYEVDITVNSWLDLLQAQLPRNVYQASCLNSLYDGSCRVSRAGYTSTSHCTSVIDRSSFGASILTQPDGYFSLGVVQMTSGANAGISRTIKTWASGVITVIYPWPSPVQANDAFTIYPGCDKTQATCQVKFDNLPNFRGFPYVPIPETVT
jgi:uncharacterized phage protein (TIGR02218 family)